MIKKCVVCGKEYSCSPTDKILTCSSECSRKRRSESLKGKEVKQHTREKLSEIAKGKGYTENLKKGTPAALKSPRSGRFETNVNAKDWILISPAGVRYECHSLSNFIRNNPDIFGMDGSDEEVRKFTNGLRAIKCNILHNRRGQSFHGWTIEIK